MSAATVLRMIKKPQSRLAELSGDVRQYQVVPELAKAVGLEESIFLMQLEYLMNLGNHEHEGHLWVFNSYESWHQEQFPFWTPKVVRRVITNLKAKGLLIIGNFNQQRRDRTLWYSIDYEAVEKVLDQLPKRANANDQTGTSIIPIRADATCPNGQTITIDNTETTTEDSTEDTDVSSGDKSPQACISPLPKKQTLFQKYRQLYEEAKTNREKSGIMGQCWEEVTGIPPDYSFLNRIVKDVGSGWKVTNAIVRMASQDVVDDPKSYLIGVLRNDNGTGRRGDVGSGPEGMAGKTGKFAPSTPEDAERRRQLSQAF